MSLKNIAVTAPLTKTKNLTEQAKLPPEVAPVEVGRERPAGVLGAEQEAERGPERQEQDERQGEAERHPGAEGDGALLREVGGPHPHQDDVHARARQRRQPADGRRVHDAEHHRLGEALDLAGVGAAALAREPLQDPRRHRHHHDSGRRVVDPHADEEGGAADAQQQQVRPHRVPAEERRDLNERTPCY
jgi:hypothetical protein